MVWLRRTALYFLSLLLLGGLASVAISTSLQQTIGKQENTEAWLNQSGLYKAFVANALDEAQKSAESGGAPSSISFSDPVVQTAAESALNPQLFKQNVHTFLNSNYGWLAGKTASPIFAVDFSDAKQQFASNLGEAAASRLAGLPVCTTAQLIQLDVDHLNPFTVACRPAPLTPQAVNTKIQQEVAANNSFLSNPVITQDSLNPTEKTTGTPYYQKVSWLPKAYRTAKLLPLIFVAVSALSALAIVFLSKRRRQGAYQVALLSVFSGASLVALKYVADTVFIRLQNQLFSSTSSSEVQQALVKFVQTIEQHAVAIDLKFGIGYIITGVVIFIGLQLTRNSSGETPPEASPIAEISAVNEPAKQMPQVPASPKPPRRPRLIQ